jgi:hypothetical protein
MSSLFDSLSEELFQILKGSGKTLTLYGSDGNRTYEPSKARRVFAVPGNMMVSVVEAGSDSEVKIYLSQSTDVGESSKLINTLRQVTIRYNVLLNVKKFGRDLEPKDFAFQATNEAAMWGSTRTSYQSVGPSKLIVRHMSPVREEVMGSRSRNILSLFVQTNEGERFKFPVVHLSGGRAFAQHLSQGGAAHDVLATRIIEMAREGSQLSGVARYVRFNRSILGEQATDLLPIIRRRLGEIRQTLSRLGRPGGYAKLHEQLSQPQAIREDDRLGGEVSRLTDLLQINSNHSLVEALVVLADLTLGENMTQNHNMFKGVLSLSEDAQSALAEALVDEYGIQEQTWTGLGENLFFTESDAMEAALDYLDLTETAYQVQEDEQDAISNYANQWTMARHRASGEAGMDKHQEQGIKDLADGLRAILGGQIQMPDYPEQEMRFSNKTDRIRFLITLFISQHKLPNDATMNYISSIVTKMGENQKLDGAEKTIIHKLYQDLIDDVGLDEAIMSDNRWTDDPHYVNPRAEAAIERNLKDFEAQFDGEKFLATQGYDDFLDDTMHPDDKASPTAPKYFIDGIVHLINLDLEADDVVGMENSHNVQQTARHLFQTKVKPILDQKGWNISENVHEFAQMEDKPQHHGFSAGDHVGSDLGYGRLISVEGDIATVEFMNGSSKEIHVDDLDKVSESLGEYAEEGELAEWFNSFDPRAVLDEFATNPHTEGKMAARAGRGKASCPYNAETQDGQAWLRGFHGMTEPFANDIDEDLEEATDPAYHSVFVQLDDGKWAHHFDADDVLDAKDEARWLKNQGDKTMIIRVPKDQANWTETNPNDFVQNYLASKNKPQAQPAMEDEELNELSGAKVDQYFGKAASDRGRAERQGDDARLGRRERGLRKAFDRMRQGVSVDEGVTLPEGELDGIFSNLRKLADDALANPEKHGLSQPIGQDDTDEENYNFMKELAGLLSGELKSEMSRLGYGELGITYNEADEEIIGGDQGLDLIDDVKRDDANEELQNVLKNAFFRT